MRRWLIVGMIALGWVPDPSGGYAITGASGSLSPGQSVGTFYVTKAAGIPGDGVSTGEEVCYRCRFGSRPMVLVFARDCGASLIRLANRLNVLVGGSVDDQLRALVTFYGHPEETLSRSASELEARAEVSSLPIGIARRPQSGPEIFELSQSAFATVVVARDSRIRHVFTYAEDRIDVDAVIRAALSASSSAETSSP